MCNYLLLFKFSQILTEKRQCWFVRVTYVPLVINDLSADESVVEWNSSNNVTDIQTNIKKEMKRDPLIDCTARSPSEVVQSIPG